jgi:plasmid stabilization system protein ParE
MKILLTSRAEKKLYGIWAYIKEKFGEKAADSFKVKSFRTLQNISYFPEVGILEVPDKQIRSFPVSTKTRVFYRIKADKLIVLTFFDSRINPGKKPK